MVLELTDDIGLFHAPRFAARLREDSLHALEGVSVSGADDGGIAATIGEALIAGIASKLSMEHAADQEQRRSFTPALFCVSWSSLANSCGLGQNRRFSPILRLKTYVSSDPCRMHY